MLLDSDAQGNTPLHYAYALHLPKMRDLLRAYEPSMRTNLATKQNKKGELPQDMGHNIKIEDSDVEDCFTPLDLSILPAVEPGRVPHELKDRLYNCPDVAYVVKKNTIAMMKLELESLIERGGVYFEVFDREDKNTCLVVLFFEDSILDVEAEVMRLKAQMRDFDCKLVFKVFARHQFKNFNGREVQAIKQKLLNEELNVETLISTGVIED